MSGAGPIVDALSLANEIDGRLLYRWQVCSWDGRPVPLSGGAQWPAEATFGDGLSCDWLIVFSERFQPFADYRLFLASLARVLRGVGVSANSQPPDLVRPSHEYRKGFGQLRS